MLINLKINYNHNQNLINSFKMPALEFDQTAIYFSSAVNLISKAIHQKKIIFVKNQHTICLF